MIFEVIVVSITAASSLSQAFLGLHKINRSVSFILYTTHIICRSAAAYLAQFSAGGIVYVGHIVVTTSDALQQVELIKMLFVAPKKPSMQPGFFDVDWFLKAR